MRLSLRVRIALAFGLFMSVLTAVGAEVWRTPGMGNRTLLSVSLGLALLISAMVAYQIIREVTAHGRANLALAAREAQLREMNAQLRTALANVKTLSGLLPICARCKKVRDDMGYWSSVERYISDHTDARFSHGVCPDCFPKMFPGPVPEEPAAEPVPAR